MRVSKTIVFAKLGVLLLVVSSCEDDELGFSDPVTVSEGHSTDTELGHCDSEMVFDTDTMVETEEGGGILGCGAINRIEVGDTVCEFDPEDVECAFEEMDDGYEDLIECAGDNEQCGFEFYVGERGDVLEGMVEYENDITGVAFEDDLHVDTVDYEKSDKTLSVHLVGTRANGSREGIEICLIDAPLEDDDDDNEDDDDDEDDEDDHYDEGCEIGCCSEVFDGHFYCEEITDVEVCEYIWERCRETGDLDSCCQWDPIYQNCGGNAWDLPCDMIEDQEVCGKTGGECYWRGYSDI